MSEFVILCGTNDRETYDVPEIYGTFPTENQADIYLTTLHYDKCEPSWGFDERHQIAEIQEVA